VGSASADLYVMAMANQTSQYYHGTTHNTDNISPPTRAPRIENWAEVLRAPRPLDGRTSTAVSTNNRCICIGCQSDIGVRQNQHTRRPRAWRVGVTQDVPSDLRDGAQLALELGAQVHSHLPARHSTHTHTTYALASWHVTLQAQPEGASEARCPNTSPHTTATTTVYRARHNATPHSWTRHPPSPPPHTSAVHMRVDPWTDTHRHGGRLRVGEADHHSGAVVRHGRRRRVRRSRPRALRCVRTYATYHQVERSGAGRHGQNAGTNRMQAGKAGRQARGTRLPPLADSKHAHRIWIQPALNSLTCGGSSVKNGTLFCQDSLNI
jgi:hypothetical protein